MHFIYILDLEDVILSDEGGGAIFWPTLYVVIWTVHAAVWCLVQAVFFGAVALTTLRMKFFWTPYMCIIATVLLASRSLWAWLLSQLRRHSDSAVCTL